MKNTCDLVSFKEIEHAMVDEINQGKNVHDHLKELSVPELRSICEEETFPFHVMALSLTGDINIGNTIRSSSLHGAEKVWIYGRRKADFRGAVGSQNYIDVERIFGFEGNGNNLTFDVEKFKKIVIDNDLIPVFVEQGGQTLGKFDWKNVTVPNKKILLVLGNETNGIPDDILSLESELNGVRVSIPQRGVIRSFNVGTAMAMVTWDMRVSLGWI